MSMRLSEMDVRLILHEVRYKDWQFRVGPMGDGFFLQVLFAAPDNDAQPGTVAPLPELQHGRKWYVSPHMTQSEVVQTAFSAVRWAEEHELRELFLYRGERIFGPHHDVNALARFAAHSHPDVRPALVTPSAAERANWPDDDHTQFGP